MDHDMYCLYSYNLCELYEFRKINDFCVPELRLRLRHLRPRPDAETAISTNLVIIITFAGGGGVLVLDPERYTDASKRTRPNTEIIVRIRSKKDYCDGGCLFGRERKKKSNV